MRRAIQNEPEGPTAADPADVRETAAGSRRVAFARGAEALSSLSRWARSSLEPPTS